MTRNEIKNYIKKKYKVVAVSLWEDAPSYIVFRNGKKKWFGIIMDVPYSKVYKKLNDKNSSLKQKNIKKYADDEIIDVMNVKLSPDMVTSIKKQKGFVEAYHMNKTHWVSIDIAKVSNKKITDLIDISFNIVKGK